ncbi:MAG: TraR/DksA family transcriptional regulator [Dehalococcoidia bacterium]|nr:TraR/DksA family transcriptional regulator [Dehalococcoidia bacterium]
MVQYDKQRERLENDRSRLLSELAELEARAFTDEERRVGSPFGKREEEAAETFEMEKILVLKQRLKTALAEIERALDKMAAGTYGRCDSCGREIESARLEALPQANLCLSCKAKQARDVRQRSR